MKFVDIQFIDKEVHDYKEAIKIGVSQLVKHNVATLELANAIFDSIKKNGPYFVVSPLLALAHAPIGNYCLKPAMALTVFKNIVHFSKLEKHDVKILITLSTPNANDHISLIQWFATHFSNPEFIKEICNVNSTEELIKIVKEKK